MSRAPNGVALIGQVLARVASDEACTAADLARHLGAARTTVFSVLRDLEAAGLVSRDAQGLVWPGQTSGALGFAAFGVGSLARAADALLPVLRDDSDAIVELVVRTAGRETVLAQRSPAGWPLPAAGESLGSIALEARVDAGASDVVLRLHLRAQTSAAEREVARCSLCAVAEALSRSDPIPPNPGRTP